MQVGQSTDSVAWACGKWGYLGVFVVCALLMAGLIVAGLLEVMQGLGIFFRVRELPEYAADHSSATLAAVLKGVEFLFIAPIPVLIVPAITRFVLEGFGYRDTNSDDEHAVISFHDVKSLTIGLMIAVVATDLVATALSKEGLEYETAMCACLVILTLAAFYFALRRLDGHSRGKTGSLSIIARSVLTQHEWQKLDGLSKEVPFQCDFSEELCAELRRLVALEFVAGDVERIRKEYGRHDSGSFDLRTFMRITARGKEYMNVRNSNR